MQILHYLLLISVCAVTAKNIPIAKPGTPYLSSSSEISSESSDSVASIEEVEEHESDLSSETSAVKMMESKFNSIILNEQEKSLKENHDIDKERSKIEKKNREALKKREKLLKKQAKAEKKQAKQMKKMKELQNKVQRKINKLDYKNMILKNMSSPQAELECKKVQEQKSLLEAVLQSVINFVELNEQPTVGSFDLGSGDGLSTPLYMNDEVSSDIIPFGNRGSTGSGIEGSTGGGIGSSIGGGTGDATVSHMGTSIVNDEFLSDIRKPGSPSLALMTNDEISSDLIPPNSSATLDNDEISINKNTNMLTGNGVSFDDKVKTRNFLNLGTTDVTIPKSTIRLGKDKSSDDIMKGITSHTLGSPAIFGKIPSNIADDYTSKDKMNGVSQYVNPSFRNTPPSSNDESSNILTQIPSNIADESSSQDKVNGVGPYANPVFRITPSSFDGISSDDIIKGLGSPGGSLLEQNTNSIYSTGSPWEFRDDESLVTITNEPIVTSVKSHALSENSKSSNTVSPVIANDEIPSDMNNLGGKLTRIISDEKSSDMRDTLLSDIVSFDKSSANSTDLKIDSVVNAAMLDDETTSSTNNKADPDVMTTNVQEIAPRAPAASNVDVVLGESTSIDGSTSITNTTGETVVPLTPANINTADVASSADFVTSEINDKFSSFITKPGSPSPASFVNVEISSDLIPPNSAATLGNDESLWGFYNDGSLVTVSNEPIVTSIISDAITLSENSKLGNTVSPGIANGEISSNMNNLGEKPTGIVNDEKSSDMHDALLSDIVSFDKSSANSTDLKIDSVVNAATLDDETTSSTNNKADPDVMTTNVQEIASRAHAASNVDVVLGKSTSIDGSTSITNTTGETVVSLTPANINTADVASSADFNQQEQPTGIVNDEKSSDMHDALLSDIVSFNKSSSNSTDLNIDSIVNAAMSDTVTTSNTNNEAAPDVMTTNIDKISSIAPAASNVDAATAEPTSIDGSTSTTDTTGETVVPLISANINTADTALPAEFITSEATTTTKSSDTANVATSLVSDLPATDSEPVIPNVKLTTKKTTTSGASKAVESTATESADILTTTSASKASESNTVANSSATATVTDVNTEESQFTITDTVSRATTDSDFDLKSSVDSAMLDPVLSTLISSWTASESGANLLSSGL